MPDELYNRRLIMHALVISEEIMEDFIDFFNETMEEYNLNIVFNWKESTPIEMKIEGLKHADALGHIKYLPDRNYECKIIDQGIGACIAQVQCHNSITVEYDLINHIFYHFIYRKMLDYK